MRIYIAGPMTGLPEFNYPSFHAVAQTLRDEGFAVVNPAEICPDFEATWEYYMRNALTGMLTCDAIYLLKGWDKSKGACLEKHVAVTLGMTVIYQ
jgi:hypothetical protein